MNADPRSLFSSIFGANMQTRLRAMALMILGMLAGCSTTPALNVEPVDVKGVVLLSTGQPATGMFINFFPTSSGQTQGSSPVVNGSFSAKLTPGSKYTFAFEGAALKTIPTAYHSNDAEHSVEIPTGGTEDLKIQLTK